MKTAGTIQIRIPAVVDTDGGVSAGYWCDAGEEDKTDIGVLYDHWWDEPEKPLAVIYITAEIDLDAVFDKREVEGLVDAKRTKNTAE